MTNLTLSLPAPAKLNLMLHITGQRDDGYHNLQTLFQFLDYGDQLHFEALPDDRIEVITDLSDIATTDNLIYRAAKLLQLHSGNSSGARVTLTKNIAMGAGLGGGSSDAATTLIALNQLWNLNYDLHSLAKLGLQLGADVPVFVHGRAAWAEGVGEQLTAVEPEQKWFVVLTPNCHVSTAEIFSHKELTRNSSAITIAAALEGDGRNDCLAVVSKHYPQVKKALGWLNQFAAAKMTGTGSSVFADFDSREQAQQVFEQLPTDLKGFIAKGQNLSPLHREAKLTTTL
ncbi:MAG: 4-(cytidine 5'-diphospho)-2-C-methyl-D-erythritol kinase [Pseudomonadales bacterium]